MLYDKRLPSLRDKILEEAEEPGTSNKLKRGKVGSPSKRKSKKSK